MVEKLSKEEAQGLDKQCRSWQLHELLRIGKKFRDKKMVIFQTPNQRVQPRTNITGNAKENLEVYNIARKSQIFLSTDLLPNRFCTNVEGEIFLSKKRSTDWHKRSRN